MESLAPPENPASVTSTSISDSPVFASTTSDPLCSLALEMESPLPSVTSQNYGASQDLKVIKNYILELENALHIGGEEGESYDSVRKRLEIYLHTKGESERTYTLLNSQDKKMFRTDLSPTYELEFSLYILADLFFSPPMSQNIFAFATSRNYINAIAGFATISGVLTFLVLFGIIPTGWMLVSLVHPLLNLFALFAVKVDAAVIVVKRFDFWYLTTNGIILTVEWWFLFPDLRFLYVLCGILSLFTVLLLDGQPLVVRKHALNILVGGFIYGAAVGCCVHFNLFPDIRDYQIQLYAVNWGMRQMFESTNVVILAFFLRWIVNRIVYPENLVVIQASAKAKGL